MTYTISCVSTNAGWKYRVTLWCGNVAYIGQRTYDKYGHAVQAAERCGAKPKEQSK